MAFGDFYTSAQSLGQSSNNTTTFVSKLQLTTPVVDAGNYRVGWNYTWGQADTSDNFLGRINQDSGTIIYNHVQEPKENDVNQQHPAAGFAEVTLTAGTHTFDIEFATDDAGDDARIAQARLDFWSVQ